MQLKVKFLCYRRFLFHPLYKSIFHPQKFSLFRKARSGSGRIRNFNLLNKFWRKISSLLYNLKQFVPIVHSSHIKSMKLWGNFPLLHGNWRPIHIHIHHRLYLPCKSCHNTPQAKTDLLRFIEWFASEENNWSFIFSFNRFNDHGDWHYLLHYCI